mmetsp:Transcript_6375/g.7809  ORF Transcript_6375/g.7809 Transcript_6375/m.7809 type:complete len:101 (+) Transcript_6375:210-512(+)|eukprot:CAMPEP_0195247998 /NCGR_PEP_ID=MMETSP0706-20130129/1287_1 /TAXON_ID=33640 /ORGANISM="Asterionellopsis glacialis, Strain CCMP134" /LENGTH=100 /DNA_ID=CAMNT_0040299583 /DNA_START=188 /DNA_END=490 /DNA_ORIENTATION=+
MSARKPLVQVSKQAIAAIQRDVFGQLPVDTKRTGHQFLKKAHQGEMIARYYPEPIEPGARKTSPGYKTELEVRRADKLSQLRRRGKGPPKKGAGKRQQRK